MADADSGYKYDVFISYRSGFEDLGGKIPYATRIWTRDVFEPELRRWLAHEVGPNEVFVDRDIAPGSRWPEELADKLSRSKLLIAVLDARYATSEWCMAELRTMLERERLLGLGPGGDSALVLPIRFADGDRYPEELKDRQRVDLEGYASLTPHSRRDESRVYRKLVEEVRQICRHIGNRLERPPTWRPDWPIIRPPASARPPFPKPEL